MKKNILSDNEKKYLLHLARRCIESRVRKSSKEQINTSDLSPLLEQNGASFVTITKKGQLQGCIGTLEAHQPLARDVCEHAIAAAMEDYRFYPVQEEELSQIEIEISSLTAPESLEYADTEDLLKKLNPFEDGVVLRDGSRRATFLPQVWDQLPDKEDFLSHLCSKMNAPHDLWKKKHLEVFIYKVESFSEKEFN